MLSLTALGRILAAMLVMHAGLAAAQTTPPEIRELAGLIDRFVERALPDDLPPADLLTESGFIRRVTLDLAGRIPTAAELERFRRSESLDKRAELVRQLIDAPDFAFHQRNELDTLLLRRLEHNQAWREYLLEATRENRSWDQMFREILSPDEICPDDTRPVAYLAKRVQDLDAMANDSSIVWFGVNVACAKCHDHPLVFDWTQSHYYGLASFFKRTFRSRSGFLGERFEGRLKYQTQSGEDRAAEFMFLTGTKVDEPEPKWDEETLKGYREAIQKAERDDQAELPPRPDFSPRSELAELALADTEQRFFAKNIVNRIWARMFGRGLVHPLDQLHSENPPSHPELLGRLSSDLIENGYDLKRLIHAIALSDSYARRMPAAETAEAYEPDRFAAAIPRPLSPHQLSLSLRIATSHPDTIRGLGFDPDWAERRESFENASEGVARQLEIPDDGFQLPVTEALWFSNNPGVASDYLGDGRDGLVGYLRQLGSDEDRVRAATRSILSRDPDPEEWATMTEYLADRGDRQTEAIRHVVWALLGTPEFRFNH